MKFDSKEIQICNRCQDLADETEKETGKYRRSFELMVKNLECQKHFICTPLIRIKENERKTQ